MFSFRKNKIIKQKISEFFQIVAKTMNSFQDAVSYHLDNGCDDEYKRLMKIVVLNESAADDLRREIETELFRKSLLPESREDILMAIDQLDELPNKAEDIVKMIYNQNISVPEEIHEKIRELIALGCETVTVLLEAAESAVGNNKKVQELVKVVDENESAGDRIERKLIHQIFHNGEVDIQTLMTKEYIVEVATILDIAQKVADTMTLIAIKRAI